MFKLKKFFIFVIIIFLFSCLKHNDNAIFLIVKQKKYNKKNELLSYSVYKYDEKYNMVKEVFYDEKGKKDDFIIYEYDTLDRLKKIIFKNIKGKTIFYRDYNYDKINQIIRENHFNSNKELLATKFKKYSSNLLIEERLVKYNKNNKIEKVYFYKYLRNNYNLIKKYDQSNKLIYIIEFKFNNKNRLEKILYKNKDNEIINQIINRYNKNGFINKQETLDNNGELESFNIYKYKTFLKKNYNIQNLQKTQFPIMAFSDFLKNFNKIF